MPRIAEMFAFIMEDTGPDDEGVIAAQTDVGWLPLVGADSERVESMREAAQAIADKGGKPIRLVRFSMREEIEILEPQSDGSRD